MGRKRKNHTHLPRHIQMRRGSYYHVTMQQGKQVWIPLGKDYGEALRKWAELEGAASRPTLTVADALAHYLDDRASRLSPKTLYDYKLQAKQLGQRFGAMRLSDLKRSHVFSYLKLRGNIAGNRERDLLRAAINHARNLDFVGVNVCENMQYRNPESPRKRYVDDSELAALIEHATPHFGLMLRLMYLTGMRIGDAISIELTAAGEDGIRWEERKTKKPRFVEWSDQLREVWKALAGSRIGAQALVRGRRGPYTESGAQSSFAKIRTRAGVVDVTLHDMRRKSASDADDLNHAQKLLGHTDAAITKRHYRVKADGAKPVR